MHFQEQLEKFKSLNLDPREYVIVGSGPLAVRELRDTKDLDVVVSQSQWKLLKNVYKTHINEQGIEAMTLPNSDIEILNPTQSLFSNSPAFSEEEMFHDADIIDGVRFISLDHLRKIKLLFGREKDIKDVELIDVFLASI